MNIDLRPGCYVVAVSGGVDSTVLLHLLTQKLHKEWQSENNSAIRLIVAHFDHGMRPDAAEDRLFVERLAASYKLPFMYEEGHLGIHASEATARTTRYRFLEQVRLKHKADAIVTAHHQDDLLETAILNLLRGTGRKGLSSLSDRQNLRRPLLEYGKQEIKMYAHKYHLEWRTDSSNSNVAYARNYVRHRLLTRFAPADRRRLLALIKTQRALNQAIDDQLETVLKGSARTLDRRRFVMLPHEVAREVMATWLRLNGQMSFDRKTIERLTVRGKTAQPGKRLDIAAKAYMTVSRDRLALVTCER